MRLDPKLAGLLSDFFLDIAKAAFIAGFIGVPFAAPISVTAWIILLTKALASVTVALFFSWKLAKLSEAL